VSRTVVIALDRSDLSARALPLAQQVAQLWRGRLVLVHALVRQDEHAPVPVELELRSIVQDLNGLGIPADAVIRHAAPAQAIVDVVREREADLIVMAAINAMASIDGCMAASPRMCWPGRGPRC
jgi:nucleotide-binding universal stress UspA family protein